jgi:hypothetical protein
MQFILMILFRFAFQNYEWDLLKDVVEIARNTIELSRTV